METRWAWMMLAGVVGCAVESKSAGLDGADDASESTGELSSSSSGESSQEDGSSSETGQESSGSESSTGCGFICPEEIPAECDVWAQDCPTGEKCAPWINDGGNSWNALRCVPTSDAGGQPGDACSAEGGGGSGIDDCAGGSMCWDLDEEGNGICAAFCEGGPDNASCSDATTTCVIANDGVLNICLPICDALLQDCGDSQACYPVGDTFACGPDVSGELGLFGDACEAINVCDAGLFCAAAGLVPGCEGSSGCCSSFCDLEDAPACPGEGQQCVGWFDAGQAPPGSETLGACIIPD